MKRKITTVIPGLGILLALLIFPSFVTKSVAAEAAHQDVRQGGNTFIGVNDQRSGEDLSEAISVRSRNFPRLQASDSETCRLIMEKTVARLGWAESDIFVTDNGGGHFTCGILNQNSHNSKINVQIFSTSSPEDSWNPNSQCTDPTDCTQVDIHGLPGRLGGQRNPHLILEFHDSSCELLYRISKSTAYSPPVDPTSVAEALYDSALEVNCDQAGGEIPPGNTQTNPESPGDQSGGDVPTIPGDQSGSNQPGSLGTLATTPIVPLAGALIGTAIGWLVSVAVTSGNVLKTTLAAPPPPAPPATGTVATNPVPAGEPPLSPAGPPPATGTVAANPEPAGEPPPTSAGPLPTAGTGAPNPEPVGEPPPAWTEPKPVEVPGILGDTASIMGIIKDYVNFQESDETIQKLHDSLQAWRSNPSVDAAEEYLKNLRGLTNLRIQRIADTLGTVGKVVDVTDAVVTGLKTAEERGYKGMDKALTVGAEVVKKDLTWLVTKNPAVGLADFAISKVTTYMWGKEKSWSVSNLIDRGSKAWDKTTQEYFGYTEGVDATDAQNNSKDNYLMLVRRIRSQVASGKLDPKEAGIRIRKLLDMMNRGAE